MKRALSVILRIVISVGLLFFVLRKVNFVEMIELLKNANIGVFLASFGCYGVMVALCALRWNRLLWVQDVELPYRRTFAYYLIGFFYNNILPTTVGGGAVRALYAGRAKEKNKEAFSSMLTELILGGWALVAFALIVCLFWFRSAAGRNIVLPLFGVFIFTSIVLYLFFERGFMRKFKGIVERIKVFELGDKIKEFYNAMYLYRHEKYRVIEAILLSFGIQIVITGMNLSIGASLGFKLPLLSYMVYPVIIGLLATIPITINGIGIREWGYRFFFAQVGLTGSQAVTLSLLFYFVGVIGSLSGGLVFPFVKLRKESEGG